jgi:hypothetical protein
MQRLLREIDTVLCDCRHKVLRTLLAPFSNSILVRVCVRFSTVDHYWVPFAEEEHMRLLPMGEAIIALPMLDAGDKRVCYQSWVTLIGGVDQVLTAVVATLGRWRHGSDWLLRGYTYGKRT